MESALIAVLLLAVQYDHVAERCRLQSYTYTVGQFQLRAHECQLSVFFRQVATVVYNKTDTENVRS